MATLVDAMIETLYKAIEDEAQFAINFSSQFEQMKKWLGKMQALFDDTNTLKSKNESIKKDLKILREVIYEADNALTDCVIRDLYRENTFFLCFLLHDPLFSYRMGKKLTGINLEMKEVDDSLVRWLGPTTAAGRSHDNYINEEDRGFMSRQNCKPSVTYGLENEIEVLKKRILGSSNRELECIGIVGMGGLGKTTIAQKLFHDTQVIDHFSQMIWVCVTQNFNGQRIVKLMLEKAGVQVPYSESDSSSMLSSLQRGLENHTYLIVMDDVWRKPNLETWWTQLCSKLPKITGKTSWIIITTRDEKVAEGMVHRNSLIYKPKRLNKEDSWSLFSESAFPETKEQCPNYEQLKVEGEQILEKCGGLPLAIKTIGSVLAKKNDSPLEWENTRKTFHTLTVDGQAEAVTLSLQLSYDELPTRLKQCLLCVSIYPEDSEIHAQQLIYWWIAEGLVQGTSSKTAIELGYEYLAELVNRCLVEVVERRGYDDRVYKCKIHDMVRELIITIAEDEAFCSFNDQGRQIQKEDSRWLCYTEDMGEDEMPLINNSKLRALFLMSSPPAGFGKNFELLQSLRVLDLSYSKLDAGNVVDSITASPEDLFNWISCLKRLACLNLSGVQILHEVPSSIRKLLNLQLLVLNGCNNLKIVHPSITSLKRLIVLDLGSCPLHYLPQGLGRLSYLQELSGFRVGSQATTRGGCALLELGKLVELRVLRMIICDATEISRAEIRILSSLKKLRVLAIDADECRENKTLKMLDDLKLPQDLQELYLRNYHSKTMPNWFNPRMLPRLQYLCVENCSDLASLTHDQSTWKIEGLCLKFLSLEVDWEDLKRVMPTLRYMEISNCFKLKRFPSSVDKANVWRKNQG